MPTYDYRCKGCGHTFELFQSMSEGEKRKCPECKKNSLERLIGAGAGLIFKGSGYYLTDYRSESYEAGAKAERDAAKSSESTADSAKGADSKSPDAKGSDSKSSEAKADAPKAESKPSVSEKGGTQDDSGRGKSSAPSPKSKPSTPKRKR